MTIRTSVQRWSGPRTSITGNGLTKNHASEVTEVRMIMLDRHATSLIRLTATINAKLSIMHQVVIKHSKYVGTTSYPSSVWRLDTNHGYHVGMKRAVCCAHQSDLASR